MSKNKKYLINPEDTPENPLTWDRLMAWLVDTGWVDSLIRKYTSPLDQHVADDMFQETWLQILEVPKDKLMEIWYRGKGKFTNYIKSIITNNLISQSSTVYCKIKRPYTYMVHLTDEGWSRFEDGEKHNKAKVIFPIKGPGWREIEVGVDTINIKSTHDLYVDNESEG